MRRSSLRALALLLGLVGAMALAAPAVRADSAMLTFGEMLALQELPREAARRPLTDEEIILYQNMEFYLVTAFETLHAANEVASSLYQEPLFCAPAGTFRFREEGDIADVAAGIAEELLALTADSGASPAEYQDKPASEVLLLGLRAAFPCEGAGRTMSAMR